jgi:hypothetical protein
MTEKTAKTGWTCPKCGRRFARVGQQHVCEIWTPQDHLEGKPESSIRLYEKFVELVQACGLFEYVVTKTGIGFRGPRRAFAGATPTKKGLQGYMDITHPVDDPRFTRVNPYTKRLFVHGFLITRDEQLDAQFADWIREAYAVGQGEHLTR